MKLAIAILALVLFGGCFRTYVVSMGGQSPQNDHYVLVRSSRSGTGKVYDCRSMPNGDQWSPTCVKVKFTSNGASAED